MFNCRGRPWMITEQPTPAVQDYLKAIHSLGGAESVVTPVAIAARLDVRAPSVTGMLKRLVEAGWIDYESGSGARLTERGVAEARHFATPGTGDRGPSRRATRGSPRPPDPDPRRRASAPPATATFAIPAR